MAGSLAGIRVVELTTMITGPLAGMMLADLGADVVKVENPQGGDPFRTFRGGYYSPPFCAYNRNKRSIALDLRSEFGRTALERLLEKADVLIENFRAGVLERLGFDDARLKAINPRLIRCSITGFGPDGPYAARPAYDSVARSLSGMAHLFLDAEDPHITGPTISDNVTGYSACYGIMAALLERERTGKVRRVDVNMLESTIAFMPDPFSYHNQLGMKPGPYTTVSSSQAFAFRCADGKLICIHLSSHKKFWEEFVDTIGLGALKTDPDFIDRPHRIDNYHEIGRRAAEVFIQRPRAEWLEIFARQDVPFAPIYTIEEVAEDVQVEHLGTFMKLTHPTEGEITSIRRPVWLDGSRDDQPQQAPPMLGEHTAEVLRELGLGEGGQDQPEKAAQGG